MVNFKKILLLAFLFFSICLNVFADESNVDISGEWKSTVGEQVIFITIDGSDVTAKEPKKHGTAIFKGKLVNGKMHLVCKITDASIIGDNIPRPVAHKAAMIGTAKFEMELEIKENGEVLEGNYVHPGLTYDPDTYELKKIIDRYNVRPIKFVREFCPVVFVEWIRSDVKKDNDRFTAYPTKFSETKELLTNTPFAVEIHFKEPKNEDSIDIEILGGANNKIEIKAFKTDKPRVFRTESFLLTSSVEKENRKMLEEEKSHLASRVEEVQAEIGKMKSDDEFPDDIMYKMGDKYNLEEKVRNLKYKNITESNLYENLPRIRISDGQTIKASYKGNVGEAKCCIYDYAIVNIDFDVLKPGKYLKGKDRILERKMEYKEDNGEQYRDVAYWGDTVVANVMILRLGSGKAGDDKKLRIILPNGCNANNPVIPMPDIEVGKTKEVKFTFTFKDRFNDITRFLPLYKDVKESEALVNPMYISFEIVSGVHQEILNDSIGADNIAGRTLFFRNEPLDDIIGYIKLKAKREAKKVKHTRTMGDTKFENFFRTTLLGNYFANPTQDMALQTINEIGKKATSADCKIRWKWGKVIGSTTKKLFIPWVDLYVPDGFRSYHPVIGNLMWIEPASIYYSDNPPFGTIDGPFLMSTGNSSSTMHWATGIRYSSQIPEDIFRELFLGYEMQHMEGWDVFGDDPINDLIAEDAGRQLGVMIATGRLTNPSQVVYAMDEAFKGSTAWVGAMMKVRIDELDRLVKQKETPMSNEWWETPQLYSPWYKLTVYSMLTEGKEPFEVKETELITRLIRTYRVIYDYEEWKETHEDIRLTPIMINTLKGYYDHQFKACTKQWGLPWDFDPRDVRK